MVLDRTQDSAIIGKRIYISCNVNGSDYLMMDNRIKSEGAHAVRTIINKCKKDGNFVLIAIIDSSPAEPVHGDVFVYIRDGAILKEVYKTKINEKKEGSLESSIYHIRKEIKLQYGI